ncbi:uncharacterized protein (DUF2141 family) [Gillisia mitskevichiae]|uniref:Uncharacterized protein (DUF2141 family) n=1 Tax=Gillisia mitskevichiae TaxID=270921 RepID=A0A495PRT8_9FLAO|nr:DUF2141 domain-containing protein [Gillisia mitskevichiae]RKS53354.1 uncharacterized protein (DUF2141 family) [Gillisia mitskevichiae]
MKTIAVLIALFLSQLFYAQSATSPEISVSVENIKSDNGMILFGVYSKNTFLKAAPEFSAQSKIVDGVASVTFKDLPSGTYAISCFHDKNANSQMDFEPTGMPLEPYGISNNKINDYGPPLWTDAKFELENESLNMTIKLTN